MAELIDSLNEKNVLSNKSTVSKQLNKLKLQSAVYIGKGQEQLLNQFIKESNELFKNAGMLFEMQNQTKCTNLNSSFNVQYNKQIAQLQNLFKTFCMMKAQVKRVKKANNNIAQMFYNKHLLRRIFKAWSEEQKKQRYLQQMQDYCQSYYRRTTGKNVLKQWNNIMMSQNRLKIRNKILKKTEQELSRIQKQYQSSIKSLEQGLQKKLLELKKQEQEHKMLHDKYQAMYERKKFDEKDSSRS